MTPEQLQELKEKAELWDSLSPTLKTIYAPQLRKSNHLDVLKEENEERLKINIKKD